jgi:hypothetical protein
LGGDSLRADREGTFHGTVRFAFYRLGNQPVPTLALLYRPRAPSHRYPGPPASLDHRFGFGAGRSPSSGHSPAGRHRTPTLGAVDRSSAGGSGWCAGDRADYASRANSTWNNRHGGPGTSALQQGLAELDRWRQREAQMEYLSCIPTYGIFCARPW